MHANLFTATTAAATTEEEEEEEQEGDEELTWRHSGDIESAQG
ncbi:uncharacterized protein EMH_0057380 [Eimeria mitis]|uniref:Uncharacterized protein n=1 Tax=Eimeria mitis TaxID=44415 RepID=U6KDD8_9EIME|nr:uncharacterized protein EMH_0057380 [Eimeria mitis]CDJ36030.1 hypothetical protein EMH_0057380 [Eimeria mitis]